MIIIRLQRVGKKHTATFRVVLTEKTAGPRRKYLELLGNVNRKMKTASLNKDRILYWIGKGAQPSDSIHNLLVSQGIISGAKRAVHKTSKKAPVVATVEIAPEATPETIPEATPAV
ncbi:MAG: 30S ribosomal protein S16 [Candidatus Azambacteria bacterium]|nr:30S ribosomal protein S16 [Candidatus Azambacteria bacterium]